MGSSSIPAFYIELLLSVWDSLNEILSRVSEMNPYFPPQGLFYLKAFAFSFQGLTEPCISIIVGVF